MYINMNNLVNYAKNIYKNQNKRIKTTFKNNHDFEKRFEEAQRVLVKYTDRIPIICERITTNVPDIDRKKYLCPRDLSIANFMYVIRKRIKISSEISIYLFVDNKIMVPCSALLGVVYDEHKDKDGFLYIQYGGESTFG